MRLIYLYIFMVLLPIAATATNVADTDRYTELKDKLEALNEPDSIRFFSLIDEFRAIAAKGNDEQSIALSYNYLVGYLGTINHMEHATSVLTEFKDRYESTQVGKDILYKAWKSLILGYYNNSRMIEAVAQLREMQNYATEHQDDYGLSQVYMTYGILYYFSYKESMKNYNKALEYMQLSGDRTDMYTIYYRMAVCALENHKYEESLEYANKMLENEPDHKYVQQLAAYVRLCAYIELDDPEQAQEAYDTINSYWLKYEIYGNVQSPIVLAMCRYLCKYSSPGKAYKLWKYIDIKRDKLEAQIAYYQSLCNYKTAFSLQDSLLHAERASLDKLQQAGMLTANAAYNNQLLEREKSNLELENAHNRNTLLLVIAIALAVMLGTAVYMVWSAMRHNRQLRAERDRTEEQRQIAEQHRHVAEEERNNAVRLSEMKTTFLHNMSHEMRTPLNSIIGFNDLLNNSDATFTPEERREFTAHVMFHSNQLMHLLDHVTILSRIDGNDVKPVAQDVNVREIVEGIYNENESRIDEKVKFDFSAVPDDAVVSTDSEFVTIILKELIDNAIKFTDEGSIVVSAEKADNGVIVTVKDTGHGIPQDKLDQIYNRFEKFGSFEAGFGLGLSCCKELADIINSPISVDTAYTQGASFSIHFINL